MVKILFAMVAGTVMISSITVYLFNEEPLMQNILALSLAWGVMAFLLFIFWNYRGLLSFPTIISQAGKQE